MKKKTNQQGGTSLKSYDHKAIEAKWQKYWEAKKSFQVKEDPKKKKFYGLIEFPYPSGEGLHVGHIRSNTAMDVIARKRRAEGYNVLYPIGWDAFGLPTENYAIKTGIQPAIVTKKNTGTFRRQLKALGFSFDWSREIDTTDPAYYKWTQWIFLQFFKKGLAYKKKMTINWCPKDLIGLANEEVIDGKCERCGTPVEKREKEQWMLAITKYVDKLLTGLNARVTENGTLVEDNSGTPLFVQMTESSAIRPELPYAERNAIMAIVKHWSEDKYIGLKWKKVAWKTLITGGPEGTQTSEEAAVAEILEETGYKNPKLIRHLDRVDAKFFHVPKNINRYAHFDVMYFELQNSDQSKITIEEQGNHDVVWLSKEEMATFLMPASHQYVWEKFLNPALDINSIGKPFLDWRESIKDSQRNWIGKSEGAEIQFPIKQNKNFVLLHGFTATPDDDFHPWLKKKLENFGYKVQVPKLPNTDNPTEKEQVKFVLDNVRFDENTILLGHSLGSVVALKVLEKINKKIAGFVTVGGFIDTDFKDHDRNFDKTFNWKFDFEKIKSNAGFINVLHDKNDVAITDGQAKRLATALSVKLEECSANESHFTSKEEPEVLRTLTTPIKVFTTRPDTLFGVTYIVLAPEHPLVKEFLPTIQNKEEVEKYIANVKKETDIERTDAGKEKTGTELKGVKAINPANNEEVPVWIADYVLADYGTGAVMAVPAHDERDWDFAKKYGLEIKQVIFPYLPGNYMKEGFPIVFRNHVSCILYNPKNDTYGCLQWSKELNWKTFIGGGIEDGEDIISAGLREIKEESGYTDVRFSRVIGNCFGSGFAAHKNENRQNFINGLLFELNSDAKEPVSPEETKKHTVVWLEKKDVANFLNIPSQKYLWSILDMKMKSYPGSGLLHESGKFSRLPSDDIKKEITESVGGKWMTTFKLRDWIFSRQRYWGEPIPVVHCEKCGIVPIPEKDLPVKLPKVKNYKPTETGESPLATISKWVNTKCPQCKGPAKRETDTMPNWAGSSWYYLRYIDPKNKKTFAGKDKLDYWLGNEKNGGVDWYNGGMEHTTLHLLYSRFWHKFLFDLGLVPTNEPYKKRTSHGLILAQGGEKMSKSKGNVVNPDGIIEKVGADSLRLYEMFMGPFDQPIAWNTDNIAGVRRFIERVWKLREKVVQGRTLDLKLQKIIHKAIKKVSDDIEAMRFNTAISALMITLNELEKSESIDAEQYEIFIQLLAPFAPHVAEELWASLGNKTPIHAAQWPIYDPALALDSEIIIMVQINGKVRGSFVAPMNLSKEELEKRARELPESAKWLEGKEVKKVIVIPNKLVNIVTS